MPGGEKANTEVRFIVDTNVGHLVRKLRMLGYDTLFLNPIDDAELIRIAREEERIIISADQALFERRFLKSGKIKGFLVDTYQDHQLQLQRIAQAFRLEGRSPFVRCLECNTPLIPRGREAAGGRVPPYVYQTVQSYSYCPRCDQFFWEGDHVRRMRAVMERLKG